MMAAAVPATAAPPAEVSPIEATAFTTPYRLLELAPDTGGVIGKVHVEEGDAVQSGQILVELKAEMLKAELAVSKARTESARVQITASQTTYETRKTDFQRVSTLYEKKVASSEDYDKAKLEMDLAQLSISNAQAELAMYEHAAERDQEAINRTQIRAPLAGEILRINKREGEAIQEHTSLLTMASVDPLYVICNLPIATAGRVRVGTKGSLTLENRPNDPPLECAAIVVDNVADAASGTYRVKLSLPNPGNKIPAGSKGTIRFGAPGP
jgi:RND family efflux transporter MFP subunit